MLHAGSIPSAVSSPLIYFHVTPYGTFRLDMNQRLAIERFRLTKHMVGGVGAGLAGFDGWLFPGEPRRWR